MSRTVSVALLTVTVAFLGSTGRSAPQAQPDKVPWQWTTEERIAKRVDPNQRAARRGRIAADTAPRPGFTPLDGSAEPELFLPVELVTRFVLTNKAPHHRLRGRYRPAIEAAGWDVAQFWSTLDAAAAPYISLMEYSGQVQREARGRADVRVLKPQVCAAAADLLNAAYVAFGQTAFDEFLYRHVAPPIRSMISDEVDTRATLLATSRGCR